MHNRLLSYCVCLMAALLPVLPPSVIAQSAGDAPGRNVADMKFAGVPGMPTCATASVQNGDPSKGASILLAKMEAGCNVPWHWHTPNENLMLVSGTARVEMKGGKAFVLKPGAFAQMPSKHAHQFSCSTVCLLYVYSDAAFDMHYVDAAGADLSPVEALKRVREAPAAASR